MARDVDLVVESAASNTFTPTFGVSTIDLTFYNRAVQIRGLKRTLLNIGCGSVSATDPGDQSGNIAALLQAIDRATGGDMGRLGAICLYGTSNGSGQTLALAKALQNRSAPQATYLGLGDLTIIPFGRDPPVPGVGNLQPVRAPRVGWFTGANSASALRSIGLPPNVDDDDPPEVADPGVTADIRENFYTHAGNRRRYYSHSPAGPSNYWWTSTMKHGEVHGVVPGWTNKRLTTVSDGTILLRGHGSVDDGHHDSLCGQATPAMGHNAGLALGTFITKLQ